MDLAQHFSAAETLDEKISRMQQELQDISEERQSISSEAFDKAITDLKAGIEMFGWDVQVIIGSLNGEAKAEVIKAANPVKANGAAKKSNVKTTLCYVLDESLTYGGRGRMPEWMRTQMEIDKVDMDSPAAIKGWKQQNLVEVAA
jgi:DNA-binding protein H-NS